MATQIKVHVVDANGTPVYDRLLEDGTNVVRFASGHGFLAKSDLPRLGFRGNPGPFSLRSGWIADGDVDPR